jgi:poly-gamma-glutamate synthesis protein (capsule biosynthesis protein)
MIALTAMMLINHGGNRAMSQELDFPIRWENDFRNVMPLYRQDTLTMRFIGDVMMHSRQISTAARDDGTYDFSSYFRYIENRLKEADIAVANMEFSLGGEPYAGYPAFSAPDTIAGYVADCGIDIFLLANNHIYDRGLGGAQRTLDVYGRMKEGHGIRYTGLAADQEERDEIHPLMMVVRGFRLALVNMTYATNGGERTGWPKVNYLDDREDIRKAIEKAEGMGSDIVIALPHWGNEYELTHSERQKEQAGWLAENGADMIIGAHPHVVQDIDTSGDVQIAYSLGNAVSNMSARNTRLEMMLTVRITRDAMGKIRILPFEPEFLWCSLPGHFSTDYTVLPVKEFIGKREEWLTKADYDNMIATYERVRTITGIEDKANE